MSNTKYTPLEGNPQSEKLPSYKSNDLKSPEVDPKKASSSTFSAIEATSDPTAVNEDINTRLNSRKKDEFEKSYSFRIKSSTIEERGFRFHYFPKDGLERFHKLIEEKIEYTTQSSGPIPFAIGYLDKNKDLITISNDEDLLGCVHWFNVKCYYDPSDIKLITYDIRDHSKVAKKFKMKKKVFEIRIACTLV